MFLIGTTLLPKVLINGNENIYKIYNSLGFGNSDWYRIIGPSTPEDWLLAKVLHWI